MLKKAIQKAAAEELLPFLRRMQSEIDDGKGIADAYSNAIGETKVIKHLIGEVPKGKPFSEGLVEAAKQSRLRTLLVFANQVRLNEQAGGNLKEALKKSLATTEIMASLQQQAEADYASKRRKRQLLLLGGAAAATVIAAKYLRKRD